MRVSEQPNDINPNLEETHKDYCSQNILKVYRGALEIRAVLIKIIIMKKQNYYFGYPRYKPAWKKWSKKVKPIELYLTSA